MKPISHIVFFIHGFVYNGMGEHAAQPYLTRENECIRLWNEGLDSLSCDTAQCYIPMPRPAPPCEVEFIRIAQCKLGDRFFLLNVPQLYTPAFWEWAEKAPQAFLDEIKRLCLGEGIQWNKEELDTGLQCLACTLQFQELLRERNFQLSNTATSEAWGASSDGCVLKYSNYLRHFLKIEKPVEISFPMTVPDAAFLLDSTHDETHYLTCDLRLFLFRSAQGQDIALFTTMANRLGEAPRMVRVPLADEFIEIRNKQNVVLWPGSGTSAGLSYDGHHEPVQGIVAYENGAFIAPVSHGLVYRITKAPVFFMNGRELPSGEFREGLYKASLC